MTSELLFGITEKGVMHTDPDEFDLDTRFRMVKESGVYDYYDKTPEDPADVDAYLEASEKYGLPIRAGGWYYVLGRDEDLLKEKLELSARIGSSSGISMDVSAMNSACTPAPSGPARRAPTMTCRRSWHR